MSTQLTTEEQRWILDRLNAAEALEQFLNTKYIGQKRFGLEGGESAMPLIDAIIDDAAVAGQSQVVIGMAHRGRLNVLINIVGKGYGELFEEFEGNIDPGTVQGSGDVKYHKGFRGKFTGSFGPDHRRAAGIEPVSPRGGGSGRPGDGPGPPGRARRKMTRAVRHPVLPLLIHGDAAFAGQGVVAETLNMSALPGYETGGTVHLVINNQLGFTTNPESARSSVYATDVAKMVQAPIFHVNGDDPEACVRVGRLAFAFRQRSTRTSSSTWSATAATATTSRTIPSLTQPLLYQLIKEHRSVRKLYTEALVRRGDIDHRRGRGGPAGTSPAGCSPPWTRPGRSAPPQPDRAATAAPAGAGPAADRDRGRTARYSSRSPTRSAPSPKGSPCTRSW